MGVDSTYALPFLLSTEGPQPSAGDRNSSTRPRRAAGARDLGRPAQIHSLLRGTLRRPGRVEAAEEDAVNAGEVDVIDARDDGRDKR